MQVHNLLPEVYYRESRDFAYVGRLIEILFNYMKSAADCVGSTLDTEYADSNLIDLYVDSLGFSSRHKYINKDLVYIASTFIEILRNKGSEKSIELAVRLLINSQKLKNILDIDIVEFNKENQELSIYIPYHLKDIILIEDIFDYILPAGMTYKFIRFGNGDNTKKSNVNIASKPQVFIKSDSEVGIVSSEMFNIGADGSKDLNHPDGFYTGVIVTESNESGMISNMNAES